MRLLFALLIFSLPARAWNAAGHEDVAAVAWHAMTPKTRAIADAILLHHPEAARWEVQRQRYHSLLDPAEDRFLRASIWPDELRRRCHEHDDACDAAVHWRWHFVDQPIDGSPAPHPNIEDGIAANLRALHDANPERQAAALAWLIHLVGDASQPLHCATKGDRGGNDTFVRVNRRKTKLHAYWDGLPGKSRNPEDADAFARSHPVKPAGAAPTAWCSSARTFTQAIYREPPTIPAEEVERDRAAAAELLRKAGARLAGLLNAETENH